MKDAARSAQMLTDLILTLFRVNNSALVWGDRLVRPFGLTSSRWQVLGTIAYADRPQSVSWLARDLGANRQNVQRIVNELDREGIVRFEPNPHHKRAQLVVMTPAGRNAYDQAVSMWEGAAGTLADGLREEELATAFRVLDQLRDRLANANSGSADGEA